MLAIRGHAVDGKVMIMLVLEPGNVEKLKRGEPIHKFLNEFLPELDSKVELVFAYTPDLEWVVKQIGSHPDMDKIGRVLEESLSRAEVVVRGRLAEDLKKVI